MDLTDILEDITEGAQLKIASAADSTIFHHFKVTDITNNLNDIDFTVTYLGGSGAFTDQESVILAPVSFDKRDHVARILAWLGM